MDGWWAKAKQRNSLRSTLKTKGQKVGRLFRTETSWDRVPHRMLTLTSGCSHLSQLLGLWAISGEPQGGMLGTSWEEDEAEDLWGIPGEMPWRYVALSLEVGAWLEDRDLGTLIQAESLWRKELGQEMFMRDILGVRKRREWHRGKEWWGTGG